MRSHRDLSERLPDLWWPLMKYVGVVVAGTAFAVGMVWITHLAAGTDWAISVVAVGIAAIWVGDILWPRRPSRLTPLQRFEEREQRRHAA